MCTEVDGLSWRTSSFCESKACVEVALSEFEVQLRHGGDPHSAVLVFTRDEWVAFLAGAKSGEFD